MEVVKLLGGHCEESILTFFHNILTYAYFSILGQFCKETAWVAMGLYRGLCCECGRVCIGHTGWQWKQSESTLAHSAWSSWQIRIAELRFNRDRHIQLHNIETSPPNPAAWTGSSWRWSRLSSIPVTWTGRMVWAWPGRGNLPFAGWENVDASPPPSHHCGWYADGPFQEQYFSLLFPALLPVPFWSVHSARQPVNTYPAHITTPGFGSNPF